VPADNEFFAIQAQVDAISIKFIIDYPAKQYYLLVNLFNSNKRAFSLCESPMETTRRSIVKSLSWRALATIITTTIVFAITGKGDFAAAIGLTDTVIKFFIYFAHERLWNRIPYGREKKQPEYYI
jgi:uncharacterized membrane protein